MATPMPAQSSTQLPPMAEPTPITHIPSELYFSNPPDVFPEIYEDETFLVKNAQDEIDRLVNAASLRSELRGILNSLFFFLSFI